MTTYQWRWQRVDRPGIWAFGGQNRQAPELRGTALWKCDSEDEAWYCYLGPVPTIAPPEPELRLPEGWNSDTKSVANRVTSIEAWSEEAPNHMGIEIRHPDRATAIRAAQRAVEEMEGGSDEP